jgi:hypothetical protein
MVYKKQIKVQEYIITKQLYIIFTTGERVTFFKTCIINSQNSNILQYITQTFKVCKIATFNTNISYLLISWSIYHYYKTTSSSFSITPGSVHFEGIQNFMLLLY